MRYKLTSQREEPVTIDGLGVLPAAKAEVEDGPVMASVTEFDEAAAETFKLTRGLHANQVTLPEGVEVTIVMGGVN